MATSGAWRPLVFLEYSDMHVVTVDLPPSEEPLSCVTDTTCALVGLSMSLEVENFQTWQVRVVIARHAMNTRQDARARCF